MKRGDRVRLVLPGRGEARVYIVRRVRHCADGWYVMINKPSVDGERWYPVGELTH